MVVNLFLKNDFLLDEVRGQPVVQKAGIYLCAFVCFKV